MERKDGNEVNEKPAVDVVFSYLLQISYLWVSILIFKLGEEVQNYIGVEENLNEEVPSLMNGVCRRMERYVEERWEAAVPDKQENQNIEEWLPFRVCADK